MSAFMVGGTRVEPFSVYDVWRHRPAGAWVRQDRRGPENPSYWVVPYWISEDADLYDACVDGREVALEV